MLLEVKGIVIKSVDYKEADKIITILTDKNGKICANARGVRRKSSKAAVSSLPFTYSTFQLFKSGKSFTVNEADIEMQFPKLSSDIMKISLASYFCDLALFEMEDETGNDSLLRLMLNSIYAVEKDIGDLSVIKSVFELKCAQIWGYCPSLDGEIKEDKIYISYADGGISDYSKDRKNIRINKDILYAINYILRADFKKMLSFRLSETDKRCLSLFSQEFILDKIEYKPKTLTFYESLGQI